MNRGNRTRRDHCQVRHLRRECIFGRSSHQCRGDPGLGGSVKDAMDPRPSEIAVHKNDPLSGLGHRDRDAAGHCGLAFDGSCTRNQQHLKGVIGRHEQEIAPNNSSGLGHATGRSFVDDELGLPQYAAQSGPSFAAITRLLRELIDFRQEPKEGQPQLAFDVVRCLEGAIGQRSSHGRENPEQHAGQRADEDVHENLGSNGRPGEKSAIENVDVVDPHH